MKKIIIAFLLIAVKTFAQDTVSINPAIQYQTIKGWGGTGGQNTQYEGTPPYLITQIINESVDDLGLTGLRYECFQGSYSQSYAMCRTWEWTNDNGSPDTTVWTAFDTTGVDYYMQNLFVPWKNKVVGNNEPFTFYESPSWYIGGSTGDIPAFLRYSPGEYAEYLISNLLYLKNKYGLTADYVTMCNEPGNGNVFTPQLVDTMMRTVGKRLQQAGLTTTIQFPEAVSAETSWSYIQALQSDTAVWPYIKCLSYHLYGTNDPYRSYINSFAQTKGIFTAQTEYIGLGIDLLYQDLTLGGVSYWDFYGNGDYMPLNTNNTWFTFGAKFWTTRQVIHHVRPGAIRINSICKDPTVKPLAFINGGQITAIILNDSATSITQPVTITGLPAGNYGVSQTTGSGTYSELGVNTVGSSGTLTVTVNAQTVMSIYPHTTNLAPVATLWAANPAFLDLPASSVKLSSAAIDPELSTVSYQWTVDSFPAGANVILSNPDISNPTASGLTVAGDYVFSIQFSDGTNTTTKQVTVQVFSGNQAPIISALQSRIPVLVTLPVDTTVLQGAAYDLEGDSLTMGFSIVSQPAGASAKLLNLQTIDNTIRTSAENMAVAGNYVFRYSVSDPTHTVYRDITITVYPVNHAPVITSVAASPAKMNLPLDSSQLSAITGDPDGDTITHWWLVTSAPAGANPVFSAQGERLTEVSNLTIPGTYVFTLRVIDRTLFTTMNDTVIVYSELPVGLLNFKAFLIDPKSAKLQWETTNEINSSCFNIERSTDGTNFINIGKVNAAGNSNTILDYSYLDNTLAPLNSQFTTVYYRLQEVDKDGTAAYSNIQTVQLKANAISLSIAPDPVKDVLNMYVTNASGNAIISIYDVWGRKMIEQNKIIDAGSSFSFNTSALSSGTYFIQIIINGEDIRQKFVKQ
jgi:hypothetical protein